MHEHTLSSYDQQLDQLTDSILEMGSHVKDLILLARASLDNRGQGVVDQAITQDKKINELDRNIEQQAMIVLALQNPLAVDLRFVISALKIAIALERMGDLAKNTAKRSVKLGEYKMPRRSVVQLYEMVDIVIAMLADALDSITERNAEKALDVWKRDDEVDDLYHQILTTMQEEMLASPDNILSCTHLVFVAKNFERIADYATNLAKMVHYIITGSPPNKAALLPPKVESKRTGA